MKKPIVTATVSLGIVAVAVLYATRPSPGETAPSVVDSPSDEPSAEPAVDLSRLKEITGAAESKAMRGFQESAQRAKGTDVADSLPFVKQSFTTLWELRAVFNAPKHRAEVLDALLATPGALDHAHRIIVEPSFATREFGEDQARARVYAIKLLEHAAKAGDPEPAKAALVALNARLSGRETIDKGSRADVRDLLNAHVHHDFDAVFRNLEDYLRETNYSPALVVEYSEALQYAIMGRDGATDEELRGHVEEMRRLLKADKLAMARAAE